jgi:hypothetical protein
MDNVYFAYFLESYLNEEPVNDRGWDNPNDRLNKATVKAKAVGGKAGKKAENKISTLHTRGNVAAANDRAGRLRPEFFTLKVNKR